MPRKKCPECKRDTWSEKFKACSSCGFTVTPDTLSPKQVTPVTQQTDTVTHVMPSTHVAFRVPLPGEKCLLCSEEKPSLAALKQRAWREKRRESRQVSSGAP